MARRVVAIIVVCWLLLIVPENEYTQNLAVNLLERARGIWTGDINVSWQESIASGTRLFPDWSSPARAAYATLAVVAFASGILAGRKRRTHVAIFAAAIVILIWMGPLQYAHDVYSLLLAVPLCLAVGFTSNTGRSQESTQKLVK